MKQSTKRVVPTKPSCGEATTVPKMPESRKHLCMYGTRVFMS